jgi:formate-dependent nitrite reductase membrane component NrfD
MTKGGEIESPGDGRNIDPDVGLLIGEGADQAVPSGRATTGGSPPSGVWTTPPSADDSRTGGITYYDRPVVKEPVWIWTVPVYFYAGGAAGAGAVIGAAAQLMDREGLSGLVTRARWIAAAGGALGTAGLIADLGRPERFLNMLRVFRPSSPMSMGSWILAGMAPMAAGSAVLASAPGPLQAAGDVAGLGAGVLGGPLAGYTGVLLANTAIPVWQEARRWLGPAFIASGLCAAAGVLQLLGLAEREALIVQRLALIGAAAELVVDRRVEVAAGRLERVGAPLHQGVAGTLGKVARAATSTALALTLVPPRVRSARCAAGTLANIGSLALKFGIFHAGKASARDPRATFHQQRQGHDAAEVTGRVAIAGPGGRPATA